jgi:hypothetical protein
MDSIKLFRALIIAMLVCFIATILAVIFGPAPPDEITAWFDENGGGLLAPLFMPESWGPMISLFAVCLALLIVWIASLIGMWKFRSWSPKAYIAVTVFGLVLLPLGGQTWTTPLESTFNALMLMCEGAVLVLLFVDPIRAEFARGAQARD